MSAACPIPEVVPGVLVEVWAAASHTAEQARSGKDLEEEHPSGAKACAHLSGFMRGLKPPPPSEKTLSAVCSPTAPASLSDVRKPVGRVTLIEASTECRRGQRKPVGRVRLIQASTDCRSYKRQETSSGYGIYRRHTECLLRRYLYASLQVGRSPSVLDGPVVRGWASSRPVRSFEDAVIFVLDVEKCLKQLGQAERQLIDRITLQEYTYAEAAELTGQSTRTVGYKYPRAVDQLTEILLTAELLSLPAGMNEEECQAVARRRRCRSR